MKVRILLMPAMVLLLAADDPKEPEVPELNRKVLEFARNNQLLVAVRGGGHNVAGTALSSRHSRPRRMRRGLAVLILGPRREKKDASVRARENNMSDLPSNGTVGGPRRSETLRVDLGEVGRRRSKGFRNSRCGTSAVVL